MTWILTLRNEAVHCSQVISATARMSSQALCAMMSAENIPTGKLQRLHVHLRHIIQSALDLSAELVRNSHDTHTSIPY